MRWKLIGKEKWPRYVVDDYLNFSYLWLCLTQSCKKTSTHLFKHPNITIAKVRRWYLLLTPITSFLCMCCLIDKKSWKWLKEACASTLVQSNCFVLHVPTIPYHIFNHIFDYLFYFIFWLSYVEVFQTMRP
jgi:hypothetical protein